MLAKLATIYLDPASHAGTARWVALGLAVWDVVKRGFDWTNGAILLALCGLEAGARILVAAKSPPPKS